MLKTPAPELFRSGRQFAAWIGLTPKDHSTAGKVRLGGITRLATRPCAACLVVGATSVIQHVRRGGRGSPWIVNLLKRKPPKLAAVALANKMARVAWKLMVTGERNAKIRARRSGERDIEISQTCVAETILARCLIRACRRRRGGRKQAAGVKQV